MGPFLSGLRVVGVVLRLGGRWRLALWLSLVIAVGYFALSLGAGSGRAAPVPAGGDLDGRSIVRTDSDGLDRLPGLRIGALGADRNGDVGAFGPADGDGHSGACDGDSGACDGDGDGHGLPGAAGAGVLALGALRGRAGGGLSDRRLAARDRSSRWRARTARLTARGGVLATEGLICTFGLCKRPASLSIVTPTEIMPGCLAHVNTWCSNYGGYGDVVVKAL